MVDDPLLAEIDPQQPVGLLQSGRQRISLIESRSESSETREQRGMIHH
jgi:hypothetical protein